MILTSTCLYLNKNQMKRTNKIFLLSKSSLLLIIIILQFKIYISKIYQIYGKTINTIFKSED